jgi:hypothetical protein
MAEFWAPKVNGETFFFSIKDERDNLHIKVNSDTLLMEEAYKINFSSSSVWHSVLVGAACLLGGCSQPRASLAPEECGDLGVSSPRSSAGCMYFSTCLTLA